MTKNVIMAVSAERDQPLLTDVLKTALLSFLKHCNFYSVHNKHYVKQKSAIFERYILETD